jgi:hypothetical protein
MTERELEVLRWFYEALGRKAPADLRPRRISCDAEAEAALLGAAALGGEALRTVKYLCPPDCFRTSAGLWLKRLFELGQEWPLDAPHQESLKLLSYVEIWNRTYECICEVAWREKAPRPFVPQPLAVIAALCAYVREIARGPQRRGQRFAGGVNIGR